MRMPLRTCLFSAAALALLGAGVAEAATAKLHTMSVAAPDGSVVQVRYEGDVAPKVEIVPVEAADASDMPVMADPFAQMERISAIMDARMNAMMQQAALMQQQAVASGQEASAGTLPKGVQVTYYSSSTDANGCIRSVSYKSDGSGAQPTMTKAASDGCEAATRGSDIVPAKAEQPAAQQVHPGRRV